MNEVPSRRVLVAGATGYIGRAVVQAAAAAGHDVVALVRPGVDAATRQALQPATVVEADVTVASSFADALAPGMRAARGDTHVDAVISCLASRSGVPADARRVDNEAQHHLLQAAQALGAQHFVLLSAICVQKPTLAFQREKLAFEATLSSSGMRYSIVRPTAFFKSLSGQVKNVKQGKPFAVFGDGTLTACKPISARDLARYMVNCLDDVRAHNAILPVGGPGPALTPLDQVAILARLLRQPVRVRRVPVRVLDAVIAVLGALARVAPKLRDKAELAKIGRYYGTESMLVWDAARGRYDADATPSFGDDTLEEHYARVLKEGLAGHELGAAAVF